MRGKAIKNKAGAPALGLTSTLLLLTLSGSAYRLLDKTFAGAMNMEVFARHLGYEKQLPQEWMTIIPAIIPAGQLVGSLSSGYILDAYGRKSALYLGILFTNIATIMYLLGQSCVTLLVARILHGIAIGLLVPGYQLYCSESATAKQRGPMSTVKSWAGKTFTLIATLTAWGATFVEADWGWQLSIGAVLIPINILLFVLPFIPDSPRWLYEKGRRDEAKAVMAKYATGSEQNVNDPQFLEEWEALERSHALKANQPKRTVLDLFRGAANRKRTLLVLSFALWGPFNGQSIMKYYYKTVYNMAGISGEKMPFVLQIISAVLGILFSALAIPLSKRMGRQTLIMSALFSTAVLFGMLAVIQQVCLQGGENRNAGIGFVSTYFVQRNLWILFWSPIDTLYPSELLPQDLRAPGFALESAVLMGISLVANHISLPLVKSIQGFTWLTFGVVTMVGCIFAYIFYPETKGKTLEQIDDMFLSSEEKKFRDLEQSEEGLSKKMMSNKQMMSEEKPTALKTRLA